MSDKISSNEDSLISIDEFDNEIRHRTLWGDVWVKFRRHRPALFGLVLLALLVFGAVLGPIIYKVDPIWMNLEEYNIPPGPGHWMGTDNLGRDMLARILYGGRVSLSVGLVAMLVAVGIGTIVGCLAGYFSKLDGPLMRFTDMMISLPALPILLVAVMLLRDTLRNMFGTELGIFLLIVTVMGGLAWMGPARVVRSAVLAIKEQQFVEAAVSIGTSPFKILLRHILPNVLSPVIVAATLGIGAAIITESSLSFLGLGFPPDVPTWGSLLNIGRDYLTITPWVVIWPGVFISLTVLSINFIGDGLRDALDPKLRR